MTIAEKLQRVEIKDEIARKGLEFLAEAETHIIAQRGKISMGEQQVFNSGMVVIASLFPQERTQIVRIIGMKPPRVKSQNPPTVVRPQGEVSDNCYSCGEAKKNGGLGLSSLQSAHQVKQYFDKGSEKETARTMRMFLKGQGVRFSNSEPIESLVSKILDHLKKSK